MPQVFRGSLKVDLVPIVWHTAPPKVRKPRFVSAETGHLGGLFFGLNKFSWPNGRLLRVACLKILKAMIILAIFAPILVQPVRRQNTT